MKLSPLVWSRPAIEARQGPGVAVSHRRLIALSSSSEIISTASRNLGRVDAPHLGRQQVRDPAHDRVGDRLRIIRAQPQVSHVKWLTRPKDDVAAPETTEPRLLRPGDSERDDRGVRMLRDECHARSPAKELPALAAMSLRK